jgi:hypothetical protein
LAQKIDWPIEKVADVSYRSTSIHITQPQDAHLQEKGRLPRINRSLTLLILHDGFAQNEGACHAPQNATMISKYILLSGHDDVLASSAVHVAATPSSSSSKSKAKSKLSIRARELSMVDGMDGN